MSRRPSRTDRPARRAHVRRLNLEMLESRELLTAFTVTSAADNGDNVNPTAGSLRAAIVAANADSTTIGGDAITFNIPGGGVQTIALPSALPAITRTVLIDASTQPGSGANSPKVVLDGSGAGAGANGLAFTSGSGSFVKGLAIVGFKSNAGLGGAGILLQGGGQDTIEGNLIGLQADGLSAKANVNGIVVGSANNTIGGTIANVISGNTNAGVLLAGGGATGNVVSGNLIGVNVASSGAVGNHFGVIVVASGNTIGGTTPGAGNIIADSVTPPGPVQPGVGVLLEGQSMNNVVQGNQILKNDYGVFFGTLGGSTTDNVAQDTIGGTVQGAGNVISGNFIGITGNVTAALIAGNTIGLTATGNAANPNGDGILLGANGTTIGGTTAAARNVISGNAPQTGVAGTGLDLTGDSNLVEGNYIGLTTTGTGGTGVGNVVGLVLHVSNSTIGGTTAGAANVISGNSSDGITVIAGNTNPVTGALTDSNVNNQFLGNIIGQTPTGAPLPNGGNGINVTVPAPTTPLTAPFALNNTIGGTATGAGNTIAGSGGAGIVLHDNNPTLISGLSIRGNSISSNAKLGIDLAGNSVPIPSTLFINGSSVSGGKVTVSGVYFGVPSTKYSIDLFANATDPSGFGQGPVYLGTVNVTTNISGFAVFSPSFPSPATQTSYSATVTGPDGNTSEFSANFPQGSTAQSAELVVTTSASSPSVNVGGMITLTERVTNTGPNTAFNVFLADTLPTSLVNATVSPTNGTATLDSNNILSGFVGSLAPGQSFTVTITGTASQIGPLVDSPGASSTTFDPNYSNNLAQQTITVNPSNSGPNADLAITEVASPTSPIIGSNLTYTVTVTNFGPNIATNATVNDFLPSNVTLLAVTPSQGSPATVNGTLVTDNLGSIAPGATATLTIVVRPTAVGMITNAANVSGNQFDQVPNNNATSLTTTVLASATNINLVLSQAIFPQFGTVGQNQAYILKVTNSGLATATNVTLIDALPANVTFVNAAPSQGGFASLINGVLTDNFGSIAPGGSATLILIVKPNVPGVFVNFAGVYTPDVPSAPASFAYGVIVVPTGPSVIGVAGFGKNSQVVITFDEGLNPITATNKANFQLVALGKAGKGPNKAIKLASVTYNSIAHSVMLTPSKAIDPTQFYQLVVIGSTPGGVADTQGRRLVNPQFTSPGANFAVVFFAGSLPQI